MQQWNFSAPKLIQLMYKNLQTKTKNFVACGALYQLYYKLLAHQTEPKFDWRTKQRSQWTNRDNFRAHASLESSWRRLLKWLQWLCICPDCYATCSHERKAKTQNPFLFDIQFIQQDSRLFRFNMKIANVKCFLFQALSSPSAIRRNATPRT